MLGFGYKLVCKALQSFILRRDALCLIYSPGQPYLSAVLRHSVKNVVKVLWHTQPALRF